MLLISFQVRRFRNILDSGEIPVEEGATCLVGKNESGKTAALQALHRLNPAVSGQFNLQADYPRWLLTHDRRQGITDDALPIEAVFELDDEDLAAVTQAVGVPVIERQQVTVTRGYDNELGIGEITLVKDALQRVIAARRPEPFGSDHEDVEDAAELSAEELVDEILDVLQPRLPRFFYFSDYQLLPGRTDLNEVDDDATMPGSTDLQTVRALLDLAGTNVAQMREEDYEARVAELEAVSDDLTRQVKKYWRQNEDLEVVIDVDKETVNVPGLPHPSQKAVARFLDIRVRDRRHGFTNNFDQRSSGFRWFFSFLAAFSEFEGYEREVIVLLDEPGLTLHARAQADFLHFIEDRLASKRQVIYTTHSPFMVAPDHLERVRIVEDQGPDVGAIVSTDVTRVSPDSVFPLQGALGYDLAQHLFVGPHNLVVEGTSDFTYLTVLSEFLAGEDRTGLDPRWRVLPVGGIQNVPTFVALLGRKLDVTVLIDASNQGMQRLTNMSANGLLDAKRIITMREFVSGSQADIEDLFDGGDYLKLYDAAFGTKTAKSKLPPGDRIVRRLAEAHGEEDFDHGIPADYLLRYRDRVLPGLSAATLHRFEQLFERINSTLVESS